MPRKPGLVIPLIEADKRAAVRRFGRAPRTTAVPVVPPDAAEDAWLEARRLAVGASEVASVVGLLGAYSSAFGLWHSKADGWQRPSTFEQRLGHRLEPIIGDLFAEVHPDWMLARSGAGLWRHPVDEFMVCTPDFLAVVPDYAPPPESFDGSPGWVELAPKLVGCHVEPVECKSDEGGHGWGESGSAVVPPRVEAQLLWQCAILGAPRGHVVRLSGKRFSTYVLEYDSIAQAKVDGWAKEACQFIQSIHLGVEPEVDGHEDTTAALVRIYGEDEFQPKRKVEVPAALAAEYADACDAYDAAKDRWEAAKNELRHRMQHSGRAVVNGDVVAMRLVYDKKPHEVGPSHVDMIRRA